MDDNRTFAELAVAAGYELSNDLSSALQPEEHEAVRVVDPHCVGRNEAGASNITGAVADTAPEEDDRLDFFIKKDGLEYAGTHLLIDLCGASQLDELEAVEAALREAATVAGATILNVDLHHFQPNGGISGVVVLSESHISIHTWPEWNYAAVDVFMCGGTDPIKAADVLREAFKPARLDIADHYRGRIR